MAASRLIAQTVGTSSLACTGTELIATLPTEIAPGNPQNGNLEVKSVSYIIALAKGIKTNGLNPL